MEKLGLNEIRELFQNFYISKGHYKRQQLFTYTRKRQEPPYNQLRYGAFEAIFCRP